MQKLANIWPKDSPGDTCYRNLICKSVTQWRIPLISFNVSPAPPGVVHWNQRGEWNKFHEPNEAACRRWCPPTWSGNDELFVDISRGSGFQQRPFLGTTRWRRRKWPLMKWPPTCWHWPIQFELCQPLAQSWPHRDQWDIVIIFRVREYILQLLSWHLLKSRCLQLK